MERKYDILLKKLNAIKDEGMLDGEDANPSENLHRLFMYPAMMVPATQNAIIEAITHILPSHSKAIDPFMGSGTSILSCMEYGFDVFGQDINPFAVLLSKAKATQYDLEGFELAFQSIIHHIQNDHNDRIDVSFTNIDKWFNKEIQIALSKIRRAIQSESRPEFLYFFCAIMSEAIRIGCNDRTSTFKLHRRSEDDIKSRRIDIIKEFLLLCRRGICDLSEYRIKLNKEHLLDCSSVYSGSCKIVWGNTQNKIETDQYFDLLVSSPPYGDNHTTVTYGQSCYLPLQWIDPIDIDCPYDYLKTTQEIDRQSLGGRMNRGAVLRSVDALFEKSPELKRFYLSIDSSERRKYIKTLSFISDFDECLNSVLKNMRPNAFYVWTIGNRFVGDREIPNAEILVDLMHYRGIPLFFDAERRILNKKQARRNSSSRTMEKERILVFHHIANQ